MAKASLNAEDLGSLLNNFTSNLYQEVAINSNGNLFFSPFSIATVLAMVYLGADGNTAEQLKDVLYGSPYQSSYHATHMSKNREQLKSDIYSLPDQSYYSTTPMSNSGNSLRSDFSIATILALLYHFIDSNTAKQLEDVLNTKSEKDELHVAFQEYLNIMKSDRKTLKSAYRIYASKKCDVSKDYESQLAKLYLSTIESVDFERNAAKTKDEINQWVDEYTNGTIRDLIPDGFLDSDTVMVLINSIYFRADWKRAFNADETAKRPFHLSSSQQIEHDMMYMGKDPILVRVDLDYKVLEIPYVGYRYSMFIILPDEIDGVRALEEKLSPDFFKGLMERKGFYSTDGTVLLPKFRFESSYELKNVLVNMGLSDLFNSKKCDLGGMFNANLRVYVSDVFHKTFIEVKERGTTAAAGTILRYYLMSGSMSPPLRFEADHPFIFSIVDKQSKTVLFIGRVKDPRN